MRLARSSSSRTATTRPRRTAKEGDRRVVDPPDVAWKADLRRQEGGQVQIEVFFSGVSRPDPDIHVAELAGGEEGSEDGSKREILRLTENLAQPRQHAVATLLVEGMQPGHRGDCNGFRRLFTPGRDAGSGSSRAARQPQQWKRRWAP